MTTLALTGATGALGGRVAQLLADAGRPADVLLVRDPARAPRVPGSDPDVRAATYADGAACAAALHGVDVLLLVSGAEAPDRRAQHRTVVAAAAEAGVRHVVYTSFVGASPDAGFTLGRDHHDTEEAIRASGMAHTLLRDSFYTEVLPLFGGEDRTLRGPAGDGRVAAVAREDVAEVAARVLREAAEEPGAHAGATYDLTGPEAFTLAEAAERLTALTGQPWRYVEESVEEAYSSRRRWSEEPWQLDAWVSTYTAIRDGELATTSPDVERLTGHPARTLEQALRRPGGSASAPKSG